MREQLLLLKRAGDMQAKENSIQADREECRCLSVFIERAWPVLKPNDVYLHNWHIDATAEKLQAVSDNEITRLQVWLPPGTMKSLAVSVFWPAWEWTLQPSLKFWTASYETRFSARLSAMSLRVIQSEWYQERWGEKFNLISEGMGFFNNDHGGSRLATAPQSTGSGEHGHRIIVDDPINADNAYATSGVTLADVNEWWDGTVSSRGLDGESPGGQFLPKHARVIVMQRLHENDLAGHALANQEEQWEILCLPERYEANHPYVYPQDPRKEGELLWPDRRDEMASRAMAVGMTSFRAAGQLQQRPAAREGEIMKRDWWRFYDPRKRGEPKELPRFTMIVVSVDCPQKDKETNDLVAIQVYGIHGGNRYLLDLDKGRMNYSKAKRRVKEMATWARKLWPGCSHWLLIENAGYGVEMIVDLKSELTGVVKIAAGRDGDKITRAETACDALESGNVYLPGFGPPLLEAIDERRCPADVVDFISSCALFPNATHDDDVDAWSQAMNWLRGRNTTPMRTSSALLKRLQPSRSAPRVPS